MYIPCRLHPNGPGPQPRRRTPVTTIKIKSPRNPLGADPWDQTPCKAEHASSLLCKLLLVVCCVRCCCDLREVDPELLRQLLPS